jgi:hypothetical protein
MKGFETATVNVRCTLVDVEAALAFYTAHPHLGFTLVCGVRASADPAVLERTPKRSLRRRKDAPPPKGGALKRIVFTIRRTAHIVVASVAIELALDVGAGALAVILAPYLGSWCT